MSHSNSVKKKSINHMLSIIDKYLINVRGNKVEEYPKSYELEVKFGTGEKMKPITRIDHDNVIKRILSFGFKHDKEEYLLRVFPKKGSISNSRIRVELNGIGTISEYCKTNNLINLHEEFSATIVDKDYYDDEKVDPVFESEDFNFKMTFNVETTLNNNKSIMEEIGTKWTNIKKTFRYINRHTYIHDEYPVKIDISVVKESKKQNGRLYAVYEFNDAEVLESPDRYEIEIEVDNQKLLDSEMTKEELQKSIRKIITTILSGIQKTNFPIGNEEQKQVAQQYMKLVHGKDYDNRGMNIRPSNFIGPSSFTLQVENIAIDNKNPSIPNIRNNYTVTDKADGERKLLFIDEGGAYYFIDSNMNVQFTGAFTRRERLFNTIIDGEHILQDKNKKFINLYMAFDIYYGRIEIHESSEDLRYLPFFNINKDNKSDKLDNSNSYKPDKTNLLYRKTLLDRVVNDINDTSTYNPNDNVTLSVSSSKPFDIKVKDFEYGDKTRSIFDGCHTILSKEKNGYFNYNIDGLIFTPANFAVGANVYKSLDESYKSYVPDKVKKTWVSSFKWKPTEYNTIDFLVTTKKEKNGVDSVFHSFKESSDMTPVMDYKTLVLRVGYDEKKHGYINPCQDVIDDKISTIMNNEEDKNGYKPVQFFPSNPSDPNAGICNLLLKEDASKEKHMFTEENEVIEDKMIVEFSYDKNLKEGWRWKPLRVRYDKTADYRKNGNNFGNAYHVANSNWHSIHYPVTEYMIITGKNDDQSDILLRQNEDVDVYYNGDKSSNETKALRDFHNRYVKHMLIQNFTRSGDTLIDLAVGKAGDLHKWITARLKFVLGVDISKDNILNRIDGACARYLDVAKNISQNNSQQRNDQYSNIPSILFINGDSSKNIRSGEALFTDKDKQIANAVFGKGLKDMNQLGKAVYNNFGIAQNGFDMCSIQFAIHYMFENLELLVGFLRNVSENTKVGGYFIATSYDGNAMFNKLKSKAKGESEIYWNKERDESKSSDSDKKVWYVTKQYEQSEFNDDETCLGYPIDIFQESINKTFREYLVNYKYLDRLLTNFGFVKCSDEEAISKGLPGGSEMFSTLYKQMKDEVKQNSRIKKIYREAMNMSKIEENISFLNRYIVYKKAFNVDTVKVSSIIRGLPVEEEVKAVAKPATAATAVAEAKTELDAITTANKKVSSTKTRKLIRVPSTSAAPVSAAPVRVSGIAPVSSTIPVDIEVNVPVVDSQSSSSAVAPASKSKPKKRSVKKTGKTTII